VKDRCQEWESLLSFLFMIVYVHQGFPGKGAGAGAGDLAIDEGESWCCAVEKEMVGVWVRREEGV
jgi:hypothetical protein